MLYAAASGRKIIAGGKNYFPVSDGKKITYIAGDFNNDSYPEFYLLFSEGISEKDVSRDIVTDIRNIYQEDVGLRRYLLAVYSYSGNTFRQTGYIMLGGKGAFSFIASETIDRNRDISAISAGFVTSEGFFEELIIFDNTGKYSVTGIRNTLSDSTRKDDIDNDGVLDLVRYEQVFVDGSGAETFITWLKFDGRRYLPVKTVNTVKDLRLFLEKAELYLEARETAPFIENSISPSVLLNLKAAGITGGGILQRIFYPVKRENAASADINALLSEKQGVDFIFPEILENPFRMERDNYYSFTTHVRVLLKGASADDNSALNGDSSPDSSAKAAPDGTIQAAESEAIYLVRIYMAPNPFTARRYYFFVN